MQNAGKYLVIIGALIIVAGILFWLFGNKLNFLGRLPGDIRIERENFKFYFPITTMILISLVINCIIWIVRRFSS